MVEHNFGTLYSPLIIFRHKKFVAENIQKMKAQFIVETSQYQWLFPLSRSKDPTDTCQSDWISTAVFVVFSQLILGVQQDGLLRAVLHPLVPTHHLKLTTWGGRSDGGQPGCQIPPGPPRTVCQLSAMAVPSGTDTPCSFILFDFPLHARHFSWLVLATSFSRTSALHCWE